MIFWVVAIVISVVVESGALASLTVQRYSTVQTPQRHEVRFRLTPTGVKWVSWSNWDMSWALATPRWIRYLLGPQRTWTVVASEENFQQRSPVISEEFSTWREARVGLNAIASDIIRGERVFPVFRLP